MKIICINGQGGCGKDSFVHFCGCELNGVFNFSMVDGIKSIVQMTGSWDGKKELRDRKFLSDLKDLFDGYCDYSFKHVLAGIAKGIYNYRKKDLDNKNEMVCFVHTREPKDLKRWHDDYGARAVLIRRPDTEGEYGNHADDQVFDYEYEYYINNDGSLEDLGDKAERFIKQIREENWESHL